ncbi:HAD family hydrolase [Caproiciproducens galactitolivorans]|uniref:Alpha-D-glucose-1-phosphate phosphatase YihX n=1 Tax=Caproiciproducens galactitolivorans TaxID=642589 RepID=A0A4Z0Y6W6_9FIRM|nr:HAD family phosphatase [Caproiciproducens galactitolivorans]TGJ75628.1 alpha-D-glucose-1-phosphate phosphatase YihX [Caproiciproducens galactitolivorans]
MIKNIVFDMGQVFVDFNPDYFIGHYVTDREDALLLRTELFGKSEWVEMDLGTMTEEDLVQPVCARLPERLHFAVKELLLHWQDYMKVFHNLDPLVAELKQNGYSLYLLSNASVSIHKFTKKIMALQYFDGTFFSADVHYIKPDPNIYRLFFEKFSLRPEECFFTDDRADNVEAGRRLGMEGFVYKGEEQPLRDTLRRAGVSLKP